MRGSIRFRPRLEGLYYSALPYQLFQSWIENGRSNSWTEYNYIWWYHTVETPHQIWATALSGGLFGPSRTCFWKRRFFHAEISINLKWLYQNRNQNRSMYQHWKIPKYRFSLQLYTKMHVFKYEFSKFFCGGAYRAPSPDPLPAQSQASPPTYLITHLPTVGTRSNTVFPKPQLPGYIIGPNISFQDYVVGLI